MTLVRAQADKRPSRTLSIAACIESWPKLSSNPILGPYWAHRLVRLSTLPVLGATFTGAILTVQSRLWLATKGWLTMWGTELAQTWNFLTEGHVSGRAVWIASIQTHTF